MRSLGYKDVGQNLKILARRHYLNNLIPWESLLFLFILTVSLKSSKWLFFLFYKEGLRPKGWGLGLGSWSQASRLFQTRCLKGVSTINITELWKENFWLHLRRLPLRFPEGKQLSLSSHSSNPGFCLKPPLLLFSSYILNLHIGSRKLEFNPCIFFEKKIKK